MIKTINYDTNIIHISDEIVKNFTTKIDFDKKNNFKQIFKFLNSNKKTILWVYSTDGKSCWKKFKEEFYIITAGGGIVKNNNGDILFIFRNGFWDLPKGKIEKKENIKAGALREVKEETGILNVKLTNIPKKKTYHIYTYKGKLSLKITHWYPMVSNDKTLIPELEEGITKVEWVNQKNLNKVLLNTFKNIKSLF